MQIKVRGSKVQLLRSEYVPAERDENGNLVRGTGRSFQRLVGSFDRWTETIENVPVKVTAVLNEDELEELQEWLSGRREERVSGERARALETVARSLVLASEALGEGMGLADDGAQEIYASWGTLQKALRKAGHKRQKR